MSKPYGKGIYTQGNLSIPVYHLLYKHYPFTVHVNIIDNAFNPQRRLYITVPGKLLSNITHPTFSIKELYLW